MSAQPLAIPKPPARYPTMNRPDLTITMDRMDVARMTTARPHYDVPHVMSDAAETMIGVLTATTLATGLTVLGAYLMGWL